MKEGDKYDLNPFSTMAIKKKRFKEEVYSLDILAHRTIHLYNPHPGNGCVCDLPPDSSAGGVDIFEGKSGVRRMGNSALCLFDSYS